MKALVIYFHHNTTNFNTSICDRVVVGLSKQGFEVTVRNLYVNEINSDAQNLSDDDIIEEQQFVRDADTIVFIYPMLLTLMPSMIKDYVDRVFTKGFAYTYENGRPRGLFDGKRVAVCATTGTASDCDESGMVNNLKMSPISDIFSFCNMTVVELSGLI